MSVQEIKDEIYQYVSKLDLSKEEIGHIDNYVNELIMYLTPLIESQEKVLNDDKQFDLFKKDLLKKLGE